MRREAPFDSDVEGAFFVWVRGPLFAMAFPAGRTQRKGTLLTTPRLLSLNQATGLFGGGRWNLTRSSTPALSSPAVPVLSGGDFTDHGTRVVRGVSRTACEVADGLLSRGVMVVASLGKSVTLLDQLFGLSLSRDGTLGHIRWAAD